MSKPYQNLNLNLFRNINSGRLFNIISHFYDFFFDDMVTALSVDGLKSTGCNSVKLEQLTNMDASVWDHVAKVAPIYVFIYFLLFFLSHNLSAVFEHFSGHFVGLRWLVGTECSKRYSLQWHWFTAFALLQTCTEFNGMDSLINGTVLALLTPSTHISVRRLV